jgi:hypothetical protein
VVRIVSVVWRAPRRLQVIISCRNQMRSRHDVERAWIYNKTLKVKRKKK